VRAPDLRMRGRAAGDDRGDDRGDARVVLGGEERETRRTGITVANGDVPRETSDRGGAVMASETPRRLGKGLGALLAPANPAEADARTRIGNAPDAIVERIPVAQIRPNTYQPRKDFAPAELAELAASLKASGLLQPITVRPVPRGLSDLMDGKRFELLAGERRFRAAQSLGWTDIPAIVRAVDDRTALTLALVENLQRSDLNPIDEAEGYARLVHEFSLTQQQVAEAVGKERSTVANILRLLNLPAQVRAMLRGGQLSLGHARALLALNSEREVIAAAQAVVARGLTVRDVEDMGKDKNGTSKRHKRASKATFKIKTHAREIQDRLRRHLQTDVKLTVSERNRGHISIVFYSNDDLERLLDLLLGQSRDAL
jgi:ParB family transcriptional regulator, chromosome partitioning protein